MKFSPSYHFLEQMANHPAIFPKIALEGQEYIDLSGVWPQCVGVEDDDGGFLCHHLGNGLFEVHTLFHKGSGVRKKALLGMEMLFSASCALEIITRVPVNNPLAMRLTESLPWRYRYTIPQGFKSLDGPVDCKHYTLSLWDWICQDEGLLKEGQAQHKRIENALGELSHPDDSTHDRFVGYVKKCYDYSNLYKGVYEYNRWALASGYAPVQTDGETISFDNVVMTSTEIRV
jgi:hypothetical protein